MPCGMVETFSAPSDALLDMYPSDPQIDTQNFLMSTAHITPSDVVAARGYPEPESRADWSRYCYVSQIPLNSEVGRRTCVRALQHARA